MGYLYLFLSVIRTDSADSYHFYWAYMAFVSSSSITFPFFLFPCTRSSWRSQFWSAQKYTLWYHMVSYKKRDIHKYQNLIQDEQLSNIFFCKSICKFLNNHKLHKSNILKTTRNNYNYHVFSSPISISSRQIPTPIQPIKSDARLLRQNMVSISRQTGAFIFQEFYPNGWGHCHSLSLASLKSRLVLPFWYRLTRVVQDRGRLNGCVCSMLTLSITNTCTVWFLQRHFLKIDWLSEGTDVASLVCRSVISWWHCA